MSKIKKKQRNLILPFCEGAAEMNLFSFLKITYSNKNISFGTPKDLHGIRDFEDFKRKYSKHIKDLKPRKSFSGVKLLFIIDNDLEESSKISKYILDEGHLVQLCDPNTEGMILSIVGKNQIRDTSHEVFRKKCKDKFQEHFCCEAHKFKEVKLREVFNTIEIVQNKLSVLHDLFTK